MNQPWPILQPFAPAGLTLQGASLILGAHVPHVDPEHSDPDTVHIDCSCGLCVGDLPARPLTGSWGNGWEVWAEHLVRELAMAYYPRDTQEQREHASEIWKQKKLLWLNGRAPVL